MLSASEFAADSIGPGFRRLGQSPASGQEMLSGSATASPTRHR